jgi:DnaK suppressor protein
VGHRYGWTPKTAPPESSLPDHHPQVILQLWQALPVWQQPCKSRRHHIYVVTGRRERVAIMKKTKTTTTIKSRRYEDLKKILEDRRREILSEVQGKIRDVRAEGNQTKLNEVFDAGESSEADIQEDIEFALIQMKAETLNKINEALARLEEGVYGNCFECGEEIAEARLRALPFAVRCKDCEEAREVAAERERIWQQRRGGASLFMDMSS